MKGSIKSTVKYAAITLIAGMLLTACSGGSSQSGSSSTPASSDSTETYTLRIGDQLASTSPHSLALTDYFIPQIEERSGGRIKCEIFADGTLGTEAEMLGQMQTDNLEMQIMSELSAEIDPGHINILTLPYLFVNSEHYYAVCDGELGEEIYGGMISNGGVRVIGSFDYGYRYLTNNKKPVNSVEDVKDMKLRVSTNEYQLALWDSLGANTVVIPFNELYTALETGTVDGQENPVATIVTPRFYECQKSLAKTAHVHGVLYLGMTEKWFQSLPEDLQQLVLEVGAETAEYDRKLVNENLEADFQTCIDSGMIITEPDLTGFRESAAKVYDKFYSQYPDSKELVQKIIELGETFD